MHKVRAQLLIGIARKQVSKFFLRAQNLTISKCIDDDQIETTIYTQIVGPSITPLPSQSPGYSPVIPLVDSGDLLLGHGLTVDGEVACCRRFSGSRFSDCMGCLEYEWTSFNDTLNEQERSAAMKILSMVRDAGERGVAKVDLQVCTYMPLVEFGV
ncbi:hypothetical protein BDZ94DRAFT_109910 [Collybia nuda]|uniref:Uncharacterized protein n=1 Tax=Collybia nuda TaxID=64659 RepID=A0A9P5XZ50_9AGAR|nr:hypothetical protein BDZ94DRAFT_109910 [Collybia nuda]